jgi:hypothetical protein
LPWNSSSATQCDCSSVASVMNTLTWVYHIGYSMLPSLV